MIPTEDYTEQRRLYTRSGRGLWRVVGYFATPSATMENIQTKQRAMFGVNSLNADEFKPVEGIEFRHGHGDASIISI